MSNMEEIKIIPTAKSNEQNFPEILNKFDQQKYWDVVNLIGKMIVDITLSHDDEESNSIPPVQQ